MSEPQGILLLDKPQGWTSHDVVARVRHWYGTRKVGHAGTLDPMATGLLVLGLGKGTKLLTWLVGADKTYTATIRLGASTPTDDADAEPDLFAPEGAWGAVDTATIDAGIEGLRGAIDQVPSAVSAIKVEGRRSYARVRAGEDVTLEARRVVVSSFERVAPVREVHVAGRAFRDVDVTVTCSSGTYVRALARDLGRGLGVFGHLTSLRRLRVGPFDVEASFAVPAREERPPLAPLLGLAAAATRAMEERRLTLAEARTLGFGQRIDASGHEGPVAGVWEDSLVAVLRDAGDKAASETVFLTPDQLPKDSSGKTTS